MPGVGWIGFIVIGILAGWIAEKVMNSRHGLLMNLVVATIGAIVLLWALRLVKGR